MAAPVIPHPAMAPAPPQNSAECQKDLDPFDPVANARLAAGARDGSAVLKARRAPARRANMVAVVLVTLLEAVGVSYVAGLPQRSHRREAQGRPARDRPGGGGWHFVFCVVLGGSSSHYICCMM